MRRRRRGLARAETMDLGGAVALSWQEALPDLQTFIEVDTRTNELFFFVLGFIVILGVINTMLMSVLERVREFGVMMAVGMRPASLAGLVLIEGTLLGFASAVSVPSWACVYLPPGDLRASTSAKRWARP